MLAQLFLDDRVRGDEVVTQNDIAAPLRRIVAQTDPLDESHYSSLYL